MSTPRLSVIIVTFRSRATIEATLAALQPAFEDGLLTCTVVDNDSGDGTYEFVAQRFPWVRAVQSGANLGFARANNLGLEGVDTPYVLFLNPDALIRAESLRRMMAFMDDRPGVGILGPAIRNNGSPGQLAGTFLTPRSVIREALGRQPRAYFVSPGVRPFRADWVCGAVMLVRRDLLDRLEGFDPRFFLYFEEMDLSFRARKLGYETWTLGEAVADHQPGTSAQEVQAPMHHGCIGEHFFRSRFYYVRKHFGWKKAVAAELGEVVLLGSRAVRRRLSQAGDHRELVGRLKFPLFRQPPAPPRQGRPAVGTRTSHAVRASPSINPDS